MAGRDPFARPPLPRPDDGEDEDAPRRVGLGLIPVMQDGTTPEQVEQTVTTLRSQGKRPSEITETMVQGARRQAVNDHVRRSAEARQRYQDEMQRAQAEAESESALQFIFRAIGDVAISSQGGAMNAVSDRVNAQRTDRRKAAEGRAAQQLDVDLGQIESERVAERDFQTGTQFDQGQADRVQSKGGALERAAALERELAGAKIAVPQGAAERDPEGFIEFYGPRFKSAMDRVNALSDEGSRRKYLDTDREDRQEHAIELKLLDETDDSGSGGNGVTPNKQSDMLLRAEKFDRGSREIVQSLDRALDVRVSGAKDIELLYNFIARMDNTAAREGELALAQRAQDLRGRIDALVDQWTKGELLSDQLRAQIGEALSITRQQIQEDRQLFLTGQLDVSRELGAVPSIQRQLGRMLEYGRESTVPRPPPQAGPDEPAPEEQLSAAPTAAGSTITVTNGTETFEIPVEDEAEAQAEGFKRVR